jgi:hypothetical protein
VLLIVFLVPQAYVVWWRMQNSAPLGRSTRSADSALAQALPVGTSRDSAAAYLTHHAIGFSTDSAAGGRVIVAMARNVDTDGIVSTSIGIRLAFDSAWRLTTRTTRAYFTGP